MLLGKKKILEYREAGHIVIDSFVPANLGSAQYDVTLGENIYREVKGSRGAIYNPFDEKHVRAKWRPDKAITHEEWIERSGVPLVNVGLHDKLILIGPGETILAHTEEFIGGACNFVTTMMKARSSVGRNFFEVCKCAGMGDAGYFNRWTMEITNNSVDDMSLLVPGRRYAQILFYEIDPVDEADVYGRSGKYQKGVSLEELKAAWTPEQMLPKQWTDRECRALVPETEPVWAAVAFVEREDGRILCVWNPRYNGWSLPGGMQERGETAADTARRELREETGVEAVEVMEAPLWSGPHGLPHKPGRASHVVVLRVMAWMGLPGEVEMGCPVTWLTRQEFLRSSPFAPLYQRLFASPEFSHV